MAGNKHLLFLKRTCSKKKDLDNFIFYVDTNLDKFRQNRRA